MVRRPLVGPISRGAARAVVVLFILAFLLAGAAYWLSVRAVRGEVAGRVSVTQLCQAGNEQDAKQITLWTHLVQISAPPPHETPAQRARRAKLTREFLAYVHTVFRQRNCAGGFSPGK